MKKLNAMAKIKIYGFLRPKDTAKKILFEKIFPDKELGGPWWTDEAIAELIGVSRGHVSRCRRKYEAQLRGTKDE